MGKRSKFGRISKDKYLTFDKKAYPPLLKQLPPKTRFWEPCAGHGDIVTNLTESGHECVVATDITPLDGVYKLDALTVTRMDVDATGVSHIITNPPWTRPILHQLIEHLARMRPTWMLFDADWICTPQDQMARRHGVMSAVELRQYCHMVAPVGRLKWIPGTTMSGKDNCCWYLFDFSRKGRMEIVE